MKKMIIISFALIALVIAPQLQALAAPEAAENIVESISIAPDSDFVAKPVDWAFGFQRSASPLDDLIEGFHNYLLWWISGITVFVMALMGYIVVKFSRKRNKTPNKFTHNTMVEIVWTVIPIIIVIMIIVPSMRVLYTIDHLEESDLTLKVTGYQWYWGYEFPDYGVEEFESRLLPEDEMKEGDLRLLEVDQPLYLPINKDIRVILTSDPNGVIHSWGIPSLKFKRDSIPGRINEGWIRVDEEGVYYGQCYELCGPDHAFMPVKIIAVSEEKFNQWLISKGGNPAGIEAETQPASEEAPQEESQAAPQEETENIEGEQ